MDTLQQADPCAGQSKRL